MELFIVISLLLVGWVLIFLEIFFIPGTTIFAFLGGGMMIAGFYFSFANFGNDGGWMSVGLSLVMIVVSLWIGFKSGLWSKLSLKESLEGSRMNDWEEGIIKQGEHGISVSRIAPSGTARFGDKDYEVHSQSEFINPKTEIEIVKIENKKIIVQTKK
ncbi:MAG: NfeD family protein [Bacteroidota bacterium]